MFFPSIVRVEPSLAETSSTPTNLGETAKHTAESLYLSAHHTVEDVYKTAQHGAEGVYATAENAARQYLPTSVIDKLEGAGVLKENTGTLTLGIPIYYLMIDRSRA